MFFPFFLNFVFDFGNWILDLKLFFIFVFPFCIAIKTDHLLEFFQQLKIENKKAVTFEPNKRQISRLIPIFVGSLCNGFRLVRALTQSLVLYVYLIFGQYYIGKVLPLMFGAWLYHKFSSLSSPPVTMTSGAVSILLIRTPKTIQRRHSWKLQRLANLDE